MTSPLRPTIWEVSQAWVDEEGELAFLLRGDDKEIATVYLDTDGEWSVWENVSDIPDTITQAKLIRLAARHIIDKAFGGK